MRQARLKPQFASNYPTILPDVWQDARALAEQLRVRYARLYGTPLTDPQRMDGEHFEFRGGIPRSISPKLAQPNADPNAA